MYIRKWLNDEKDGGMAAIIVQASARNKYIDADVQISDCSRNIHLDFGIYSDTSASRKVAITKRMKKLKLLIDSLNKLYDFLEEERAKE